MIELPEFFDQLETDADKVAVIAEQMAKLHKDYHQSLIEIVTGHFLPSHVWNRDGVRKYAKIHWLLEQLEKALEEAVVNPGTFYLEGERNPNSPAYYDLVWEECPDIDVRQVQKGYEAAMWLMRAVHRLVNMGQDKNWKPVEDVVDAERMVKQAFKAYIMPFGKDVKLPYDEQQTW